MQVISRLRVIHGFSSHGVMSRVISGLLIYRLDFILTVHVNKKLFLEVLTLRFKYLSLCSEQKQIPPSPKPPMKQHSSTINTFYLPFSFYNSCSGISIPLPHKLSLPLFFEHLLFMFSPFAQTLIPLFHFLPRSLLPHHV